MDGIKYSQELRERVCAEIELCEDNITSIARKHGVAPPTARHWARKYNLKRKIVRTSGDIDWGPIDEYLGKIPDTRVGKQFNISATMARNRRIALGIEPVPNYRQWSEELRSSFECIQVQDMWEQNYQDQQVMNTWGRSKQLREFVECLSQDS